MILDGDVVPQSRLNEIFAFLGDHPSTEPLQTVQIDLEPFLVSELVDVGRHSKVLPGTIDVALFEIVLA